MKIILHLQHVLKKEFVGSPCYNIMNSLGFYGTWHGKGRTSFTLAHKCIHVIPNCLIYIDCVSDVRYMIIISCIPWNKTHEHPGIKRIILIRFTIAQNKVLQNSEFESLSSNGNWFNRDCSITSYINDIY